MTPYYMSFVKDGVFAGACLVYASDAKEATIESWKSNCNPGGEILFVEIEFIPDQKWFYRLLSIDDLRDMEREMNETVHKDNPKLTPRLYT